MSNSSDSYVSSVDRGIEMRQLGAEISAQLGDGWSVDQAEQFQELPVAYLDGPDGARLMLNTDWRDQGRIKVSGCYPTDHNVYRSESHDIGVSRNRGSVTIAREITRRLMPAYLPELQVSQQALQRSVEAFQARTAAAEQICAALPGTRMPDIDSGRYGYRIYLEIPGPIGGTADLHHAGDGVTLELRSVPTATLLRIFALITEPT